MRPNPRWGLLAAAAAAVLGVTGCTAAEVDPAVQAEQTAKFAACLDSEGLQTRMNDIGLIEVRRGDTPVNEGDTLPREEDGTDLQSVSVDEDGILWAAGTNAQSFANDPVTHAAYQACEADYPDFVQRAPDLDPEERAQAHADAAAQEEQALAFARCARDAGFAWVADPSNTGAGGIVLPPDLTEEDFRALLTACPEQVGLDGNSITFTTSGELAFDWNAVWAEVADAYGGDE